MSEPILDREFSPIYTANNNLYYQADANNVNLLAVTSVVTTNANGVILGTPNGASIEISTTSSSIVISGNATSNTIILDIRSANTTQDGSVQLSDNVSDNTITKATTANVSNFLLSIINVANSTSGLGYIHASDAYAAANAASSGGDPGPAFAQANGAWTQANTARTNGNNAYTAANTSFTHASNAYAAANTGNTRAFGAFAQANGAWTQANTARTNGNNAYTAANTAYTHGTNAYAQANTGNTRAFGAFAQANGAWLQANTARTNGNNAYARANVAYTHASNAYTAANTAPGSTGYLIFNTSGAFAANSRFIVNLGSNTITFSTNMSVGYLNATGEIASSSDIAFKSNVANIANGMITISSMRPVEYNLHDATTKSYGFIAQEMEKILPDIVKGEDGSKNLAYLNIIAVLVKAVQELDERVKLLEGK